ncbi:hypothetical protein RI054_35g134580 [Pseudoscourfieldia marina]
MSTDGYLILGRAPLRITSSTLLEARRAATSRSKHSWEISGAELYGGSASRSIRSKDYERESTSSGDNLHNHLTKSSVARAARGQRSGRLARPDSSSTTTRGNTYPIKIVDNFLRVEVAPPLDFDMTIDTTFHQSQRLALRPEQNSANIRHRRDTATKKLTHLCRGRVEGKAHDIPKHRQSERTDRVGGALVHTDIKTDVPTPSYRGDKYFIHFTDDKTRHTVPYALRKKSDSANALLQYVAFMRSKGIEIKELRADSEKVLNEGEMKKTALANNIHTSTTPPYQRCADCYFSGVK